jgi:hypothetical protein
MSTTGCVLTEARRGTWHQGRAIRRKLRARPTQGVVGEAEHSARRAALHEDPPHTASNWQQAATTSSNADRAHVSGRIRVRADTAKGPCRHDASRRSHRSWSPKLFAKHQPQPGCRAPGGGLPSEEGGKGSAWHVVDFHHLLVGPGQAIVTKWMVFDLGQFSIANV